MAAVTAGTDSHHDAATGDLNAYMLDLGARARAAAETLAGAPTEAKNAALVAIADAIADRTPAIKSANRRDLDAGRSSGLAAPLLDRLELTDARIRSMADGLRQIAAAPGPRRRGERPEDAAVGIYRSVGCASRSGSSASSTSRVPTSPPTPRRSA